MVASKLQVTGINHVVLHVTDLERSKRFYMDVLGFEDRHISAPPDVRVTFLRCGMQGLDLFEVSGDAHGEKEIHHMALDVDAEDLDELMTRLSDAGVAASRRTQLNSAHILDPDGHRLELLPRTAIQRAHARQENSLTGR